MSNEWCRLVGTWYVQASDISGNISSTLTIFDNSQLVGDVKLLGCPFWQLFAMVENWFRRRARIDIVIPRMKVGTGIGEESAASGEIERYPIWISRAPSSWVGGEQGAIDTPQVGKDFTFEA